MGLSRILDDAIALEVQVEEVVAGGPRLLPTDDSLIGLLERLTLNQRKCPHLWRGMHRVKAPKRQMRRHMAEWRLKRALWRGLFLRHGTYFGHEACPNCRWS
jgi:hypothetical protein